MNCTQWFNTFKYYYLLLIITNTTPSKQQSKECKNSIVDIFHQNPLFEFPHCCDGDDDEVVVMMVCVCVRVTRACLWWRPGAARGMH